MSKTRLWKISLVVLCAIFFTAVVITGIYLFPEKDAVAQEQIVLEGNTADYTVDFETDDEYFIQYDSENNVWKNEYNWHGKYGDPEHSVSLVLNITSAGDVEFKWKFGSQGYSSNNTKGTIKVIKTPVSTGEPEDVFTSGTVKNNTEATQKVENLEIGDKVTITYSFSGGDANAFYDYNYFNFRVWGLKKPQQQVHVKANAVVVEGFGDAEAGNKITHGGQASESLDFTQALSDKLDLVSTPAEGYLHGYWSVGDFYRDDQALKGARYATAIPTSAEKNVYTFKGKSVELAQDGVIEYETTAYFAKDGVMSVNVDNKEQQNGWIQEGEMYKIQDVNGELKSANKVKITVEFYGAKYFKFDYDLIGFITSDIGSSRLSLAMTCDGQTSKFFSGDLDPTYVQPTAPQGDTTQSVVCYFADQGYHKVEFNFYIRSARNLHDWDRCSVGNFAISDDPVTKGTITLKYNPDLADLYVADQLDTTAQAVSGPDENGLVTYNLELPMGNYTLVEVRAKSSITSSIDLLQQTGVYVGTRDDVRITNNLYRFQGSDSDRKKEQPTYGYGNNQKTWIMMRSDRVVLCSDSTSKPTSVDSYSIYDVELDDEHFTLTYNYQEKAILPEISFTKMVTGSNTDLTREQVESADNTVNFNFGQQNSLQIKVKTTGIREDELKITVDGVIQKLISEGGYYSVLMADVTNHTVTISLQSERYYSGDAVFTFKVCETIEGGSLQDIIHKGSDHLTVSESTQEVPEGINFEFWPASSTSENRAYKFDGSKAFADEDFMAGGAVLQFANTNKDAGMITFEFQMAGEYFNMDMSESGQGGKRLAQLFVKTGVFDSTDINDMENALEGEFNPTNSALKRYAWTMDGNLIGTSAEVMSVGGGWYRAKIKISENTENISIGFLFAKNPMSSLLGGLVGGGGGTTPCYLTVRDFNYYTGIGSVTVDLVTKGNGGGTVTSNIGEQSNEKSADKVTYESINIGETLHIEANVPDGQVFFGWSINGEFYADQTLDVDIVESTTDVIAYIGSVGDYEARIKGKFYEHFAYTEDSALSKAQSGDEIVIVINNYEVSSSLEIPVGISVILPYSVKGEYYGSGIPKVDGVETTDHIAWATTELEAKFKYFTMTIADEATLTIRGSLFVGGILHYPSQSAQAHTSGAYSHLVNNGTIVVEQGGVFDVYGRVTGEGEITINNGGKLYEPFLILDYPGGSATLSVFMDGLTPFKRYAMINIESPITVNYGGQLVGHASLFALGMMATLDQPFISDMDGDGRGNDTFVMLHKGASVRITYDPATVVEKSFTNNTELIGRTKMVFTGGATFSYMTFSAMGATVPTKGFQFSIPYNFDVVLGGQDAEYETVTEFMIMPGATVTVDEGATLTLKEDLWVFPGLVAGSLANKSYPSAEKLQEAGLSTEGNLIVNGNLVVKSEKSTVVGNEDKHIIFVGVVQSTSNTGKIVIEKGVVLNYTIKDGAQNNNYFETTLNAYVFDRTHVVQSNVEQGLSKGTLVKLEAGKTYKATSGDEWTLSGDLGKLNYGSSAGATTAQLTFGQKLHGSWMLEHEDHILDLNYIVGDQQTLDDENKHITLTLQCQVAGCEHTEEYQLVLAPENWGQITYTGKTIEEQQIKDVINALFGSGYDLFELGVASLQYTPFKDYNTSGYTITVTFERGFWMLSADGELSGDNVSKSYESTIHVVKATLKDGDVQVNTDEVTYTGDAITKQVVVTYNGVTLAEHTDYDVKYSDNHTNVGEVTITVTGTGTNFAGTVTKTFRIVPRSVSDASVVYEREKEYTGDQIQPSVTSVTVNGNSLIVTTDYTVEYGANLDKGTGTVTIKGNGNYNGEKQLEFNILAKNMSKAKVTVEGEYTFDGQKQEPKVTVSLDGFNKQLNKDTDYDLSFGESDLIKAETVTVTVTFKGNYEGTAQGTFEIKQKDIAGLTFGGVNESYTYTGKAIQPTVTVKFEQVDLTKDDFDVVYGTNTAVAEQGTVTVNGKGNYTGSKQFTFTITPADASQAQVKVNGSYTYNAQAQSVQVTVTLDNFDLTSSDYTIEYGDSDRTNAGTVNFTVKFTGNFSGSVEQSFEIGKAQVKVTPNNAESPKGEAQVQLSYRIDGTMYGDDLNTLKSVLTVKLANDENVSEAEAGAHFDIVVTLGETELTKNYNIDVSAKGTYIITEAVFKGVDATNVTVDYDGKTHPVTAQGLPDGAKATYVYKQGDSAIEGEPKDVGNYNVTITVTMGSYKPFVFNRTVTITAKKLTVTLQKQSVVFNAKEQHASSDKQYWSVEGVVEGESVTLTIAGSLTNVGSANLVATPVAGEGTKLTNYSVDSAQLTLKDGFTVEQKDIAGLTFGGVNGSYTYTGKAIQPTVTVKFGEVDLTKDDFDVVYGANTAVAEKGTVTVNGKGNYTGTKELTFTITPADASQAQVKVNGSYTYNAQAQDVQVTVTLANFAVTSSDYTIEYGDSDRTNAGTVKFTVQFKGNFSGSVSSQFEIGKATVTEITVNEGTSFTYDGEEQQLTFVVKAGVLTLSTGDYDLSNDREDDLTNAGAVNFTAKGKGNFQGEKSVTVTIARAQLTQVTVQNKDSHVYNGKQQQVELEVKAGDLTANVNDDYTVNYQGNLTNAGTVTVTVTGKGNFQGEVSDEFVIAKAEIGISVEDKNSVYGYDTVALTYVATGIAEEDKTSVLMDAYVTLSCSASAQSDADEYDITATVSDSVSELANYTVRVTRQGTYTINARPLTVTIRDQQNVYGYNKTYDFDLTAWDITSGELVEGDELHFTLVQPQFDGAGDYNITVTESELDGNYALTFEGSNGTTGKYSISKLDVSDSAVFYVTSGDMQVDDNGVVKLDGDAVEFTGGATVMEDKLKELKVSIDPQSIDSTGEHTLTLTIEDKNYSGSKSYSITVIDGDMSAELYKALRDLEALTGDMQPNELETKQEHYELVKGVRGILDGLSDEVWDEGEEELSFYQEFVDVWDNSADVDDNIVQTAKAIADAPIKGLFVVATLNALLAVAYAVAKGGIL